MANSITITTLLNGSKLGSYRIDIVGDGSGDETAAVLLDPTNMTGKPTKFKIRAIQWDLVGFDGQLKWDADTDVHAFEMPGGVSGGHRFADTGAHLTNTGGTGVTGKLLLATSGLGATGKGSIFIETQAAS